MDANDPERGGGITEQAYIKLLRSHTSEGPDLQKGLAFLAANPLQAEPCAPRARSLSQGDFGLFKKVYEGNRTQRMMHLFPFLVSAYYIKHSWASSASPCIFT